MTDARRELDALMEDVMTIRRGEDAKWRREFDLLPPCVQRTLFVKPKSALGLNDDELVRLERDLCEVWFVELKPNAPHWGEKGVRDEWITITTPQECPGSLVEMAACYFKLGRWKECESHCNFALRLDSGNPRALVRRAQCRLAMNSRDCTTLALKDLQRANALLPADLEILHLLRQVQRSAQQQEEAARQVFGGIFHPPVARAKPRAELQMMLPSPLVLCVLVAAVLVQVYIRLL
ncbi:hypothetical protein BASA81_002960 [Batrachochytrium salamandrivorans]|nr:hypothetical protein BASA81_002960 [Batrachochytrium salamandrivorans]